MEIMEMLKLDISQNFWIFDLPHLHDLCDLRSLWSLDLYFLKVWHNAYGGTLWFRSPPCSEVPRLFPVPSFLPFDGRFTRHYNDCKWCRKKRRGKSQRKLKLPKPTEGTPTETDAGWRTESVCSVCKMLFCLLTINGWGFTIEDKLILYIFSSLQIFILKRSFVSRTWLDPLPSKTNPHEKRGAQTKVHLTSDDRCMLAQSMHNRRSGGGHLRSC